MLCWGKRRRGEILRTQGIGKSKTGQGREERLENLCQLQNFAECLAVTAGAIDRQVGPALLLANHTSIAGLAFYNLCTHLCCLTQGDDTNGRNVQQNTRAVYYTRELRTSFGQVVPGGHQGKDALGGFPFIHVLKTNLLNWEHDQNVLNIALSLTKLQTAFLSS